MSLGFWLKRFTFALFVASAALFCVQYLKGSPALEAVQFGLVWGVISAALFTLIGYIRYRRNPACMLPRSSQE
jgi:phosphatidylglycerophosphate synthase